MHTRTCCHRRCPTGVFSPAKRTSELLGGCRCLPDAWGRCDPPKRRGIVEVKTKLQIIFLFSEITNQNDDNKSFFRRENRESWRSVVTATINLITSYWTEVAFVKWYSLKLLQIVPVITKWQYQKNIYILREITFFTQKKTSETKICRLFMTSTIMKW